MNIDLCTIKQANMVSSTAVESLQFMLIEQFFSASATESLLED